MIQININDIANKVRSTVLTGLNTALTGVITATDTVLEAFGKLQNQISGKVDKAGDTMTGDLTMTDASINTVDSIGFDTVSPAATISVGEVRWNNTDGTTERLLKGGNIYLQDGQEIFARVVNKTNSNVLASNYQVVKVTSAQGQRLAVNFAQANNDPSSVDTLGVIAENINNNQEGFITILGTIKDINTTGSLQGETWADGDVLYLSPTVAGSMTNIKPTAPNHMVAIGYVEYAHANNGKIFVKIQNGYELTELHDVYAPSPSNGDTIKWNSTNSRYENGTFVSSVAALTLGTTGTDLSSTVANGTTTPVITLNVPTASATNRGVLSSTDWSTFNNKQNALGFTPVPDSRTLTINGTTFDLTANRSWTIASGLTVGTTPVTSGTVGRIFFQGSGDVVQQDSTLFWDNTNKRLGVGATPATTVRLDVRAQGALSTDIAFRVRNSADTQNLMSIAGNGDVAIGLNASGVTVASYPFISIGLDAKASQYGISIGANAGKNQDNGDRRNVYLGADVALIGTNVTGYYNVGIGNNALYRVSSGNQNVAIGGSNTCFNLSTGSNNSVIGVSAGYSITTGSGNTHLGSYSGTQNATGSYNTQIGADVDQGTGVNKSHNTGIGMRLRSSHNGTIMLGSSGNPGVVAPSIADDAAQFHFRSDLQSFFFNKNTNVVLKSNSALTSGTHFEAAATNTITIHNGTAPVANITDAFGLYSADIVAGNAAPHFRTENGDIIKLYRVGGWGLPTGTFTRTTFDTATVTTAQLAERVAALIQDLRDNHGLLKA